MNIQQLEAFLKIVEMGSISGAAEMLFISQSTVSDRLRNLEEELNTQLVFRGPGVRNITLSQRGVEFLAFANRMVELEREVKHWKKHEEMQRIRIGAPQSIHSHFFKEFYGQELNHPEINLEISAHWNETIYRMVNVGELDLGIVSRPYHSQSLDNIPLFREDLFVVFDSQFSRYDNLQQMTRQEEIYMEWGPAYLNWYQRHWNLEDLPKLTLDSPELLMEYLKTPQTWAIVPHCIYRDLLNRNSNIQSLILEDKIYRELFLIYLTNASNQGYNKHLLSFIERLHDFVLRQEKVGNCWKNS